MGFVSGTLEGPVAETIVEYSRLNPRVRFHLTESSADKLMDLIRQEKLDMAIVDSTDRDRSLHFRKLNQRNFYAALPRSHRFAEKEFLDPQEIVHEPQIVFNYDVGKSFKEWTSGAPMDESVLCTVDTAQAALDLVAAGMGIAFIPERCIQDRREIAYVKLNNWHQALYMCILYDKWLEPPVWDFVELVVKTIRNFAAPEIY
jgi:DNA-binding transcriptional LysR family regulator